ncbi:DDE domain-containing protein [Litoreibacter ascidiaceicola]|uniref:DDE domain-containing protein n=1 Tax=Litoreibacter ascidiaceicola TaxID=1486859 RepID=A0A1M5BJY8_9RHOB|nr:DDE-type integrase/transposase/recombinase [Litoreibacter ascidiaceicola]SHF42768.1 DDE domain-containing protein [Litoreibacter ascidiaceicola]
MQHSPFKHHRFPPDVILCAVRWYCRFELPGEGIVHINRKWENNRIESDHAALKKLITPMRGFKSLSSAKATLHGIEAIRTIKRGHVHGKEAGITGEIRFVESLFGLAA